MPSAFMKQMAGFRLFDFGAALLFFGVLAQQPDLQKAGTAALAELAAQGYRLPGGGDPLRVFPALTDNAFGSRHAGGWRPGVIYLRNQPQGGLDASVYLRHELFHEASHRTCRGDLPIWAEEAAAMRFSGELAAAEAGMPKAEALQQLKRHVMQGREPDAEDRIALGRLAANAAWPAEPCSLPAALKELLGGEFTQAGNGAYLLMSLPSGRVLESSGGRSPAPPGSLLKIPYAASLGRANPKVLAQELALSDTHKLMARRGEFQADRYRLLLSVLKQQPFKPSNRPPSEQDWLGYLGERGADGQFPIQAALPELALSLRAALLAKPEYFQGLTQNGGLPGSTLAGQNPEHKKILGQLQAMVKTGSVSDSNGRPLLGHLMAAWPAEHPVFLAVFRQNGVKGAAILPKAAELLKTWRRKYPPEYATARVRLLTPTPRASWEALADCPELTNPDYRFSVCGGWRIVSTAVGSRSERLVSGLLSAADDKGPVVLETDSESYADAVLAAEAQTLTGAARQAMRAVIVWNAAHGAGRHADSHALCDTTHCMVFLGLPPGAKAEAGNTDFELVRLLDKLAGTSASNWLPFSNGGGQRWQKQIPAEQLTSLLAENRIFDIRRERRKSGEVAIHLYYPETEETVACEIFRNRLKLPSCPDAIQRNLGENAWLFRGVGAGHGLGLSILQAQAQAEQGLGAERILRDAYGRMSDIK